MYLPSDAALFELRQHETSTRNAPDVSLSKKLRDDKYLKNYMEKQRNRVGSLTMGKAQ
jgi:hypothetical protein